MKRTDILQTLRANLHSALAFLFAAPGLYMTLAGAAWGDHNFLIAALLFFPGILLLAAGFDQIERADKEDEPFVRWIEEDVFGNAN